MWKHQADSLPTVQHQYRSWLTLRRLHASSNHWKSAASLPNSRSPLAKSRKTAEPARHCSEAAAKARYQPERCSAPPPHCRRKPVAATPTTPASVPAVLLMPLQRDGTRSRGQGWSLGMVCGRQPRYLMHISAMFGSKRLFEPDSAAIRCKHDDAQLDTNMLCCK